MRTMTSPAGVGAVAGLAIALSAGAASAVTINFADGTLDNSTKTYTENGIRVSPASIDSSANCPGPAPCLLQNNGAFSDVNVDTVSGDTFDLNGFSYHFVGDESKQRGILTVSDSITRTFTQEDFGNGPFTVDLGTDFQNVSGITFSYSGPGSARLDNLIIGTVSAVPLPAGISLLLSALAGFGYLGWRKRTAVA